MAVQTDPKQADAWYWRGRSKEKLGDQTGGAADIAQARTLDPSIGK